MSTSPDCCIIGGGIIGLSIARELAGRGLHVTLLARDRDEKTDLAAAEAARLAAMLGRLKSHTAEIEAEGPDWWRAERRGGSGGKRRAKPVPAG